MQSKTTAKDFFLYLAVFVGLYASTISFLTLSFAIIEKIFPLTGEYYLGQDDTIRNSIAILVIFLSSFIYISYLVNKDLKNNPGKKELWVRKWLIYFTLFIAGITVAIDLVTLIQRFLSADDMTLRFILKVILVLLVAVSVFKYYLYDLRRDASEFKKPAKIFIWSVGIISLASIVYGIILVGSPALQRARNMDQERVNDLSGIQSQIVSLWQVKGIIPSALSDLNDPISGYTVPKDPKDGTDYEYKKLTSNSFELCATFETDSSAQNNPMMTQPMYYPQGMNENWQHTSGNICFDRTIDPTIYKPSSIPTK